MGAFGTVASVNGVSDAGTCGTTTGATDSFTITGHDGTTFTVNVTGTTMFEVPGVTDPTFANVCVGEKVGAKGALTDAAYIKARDDARRLAGKEGLLAVLDKNNLDALIAPSMSPAWPTDPVLGDHFVGAGYGIAAVAGTPSITVPAGNVQGLPVGMVFMGRPWSEPELLGFAYAFEQATRARKAPEFKPTLAP